MTHTVLPGKPDAGKPHAPCGASTRLAACCTRAVALVCLMACVASAATYDASTGYVMVEQRGRRGDSPLDYFSAQPLIYNAEEDDRDAYYWSDHLAAHANTNYYVPFPIRGVLCIEEGLAATNYVFPGDSLVLSGAGNIQWKHFHPTTYTIPNLIALDGSAYWSNEWAKRDPYVQLGRPDLHGRITIGDVPGAPAAFSIQANDHIDNWGYEIWNDIYGEANKTLNLTFNAGSPRSGWFRLLGDHSNFHGSAVVVSNALELGASGFADATVRLERKASVAPCAAAGASVPISNLVVDATSKIVLNPSNGLTVARLMLGAGAAFDVAAGATPLHVTDTLDLQGHAKVSFAVASSLHGTAHAFLSIPAGRPLPAASDFELAITGQDAKRQPSVRIAARADGASRKLALVVGGAVQTLPTTTPETGTSYYDWNHSKVNATDLTDYVLIDRTCWPDGRCVHPGASYAISQSSGFGPYFGTRDENDPKRTDAFAGDSLYLGRFCSLVLRQRSYTVPLLQFFGKNELCFSGKYASTLSGEIEMIRNGAEFTSIIAGNRAGGLKHTLAASIRGDGGLNVQGSAARFDLTPETGLGDIEFSGDNRRFTGLLSIGRSSQTGYAAMPTTSATAFEKLQFRSAKNLGGELASFAANGITLLAHSVLEALESLTYDTSTRGIFIDGNGGLSVVGGATFTMDASVTYNGTCRKYGAGTLVVNGAARFTDGTDGTAPTAGKNVLEVREGFLRPGAREGLDGVAVSFTGTGRLLVDPAASGDAREKGLYTVKAPGGISSPSGKVPVTFDVTSFKAPETFSAVLCTTADDSLAFSFDRPWEGYVTEVTRLETDPGVYTYSATSRLSGLALIFR